MTDDSKKEEIEKVKAEIVDPDKIELLDSVKVAEDHPSLLPAPTKGSSVAGIDPLTAYLNEIRRYDGLTEEEERELAVKLKETGDANAAPALPVFVLTQLVLMRPQPMRRLSA